MDNTMIIKGESYRYYQVGVHYGAAQELKDLADHVQKLESHYQHQLSTLRDALQAELPKHSQLHVTVQELPSMANALGAMHLQIASRAKAHSDAGAVQLRALQEVTPKVVEKRPPTCWWLPVSLCVLLILGSVGVALYLGR